MVKKSKLAVEEMCKNWEKDMKFQGRGEKQVASMRFLPYLWQSQLDSLHTIILSDNVWLGDNAQAVIPQNTNMPTSSGTQKRSPWS